MIQEGKKRGEEGAGKCLFIWKIREFWEVTDVLKGPRYLHLQGTAVAEA